MKSLLRLPATMERHLRMCFTKCRWQLDVYKRQGTYTQVESSPVSPLEIPMAFVRTLGSSSVNEIIFFIFLIGGAFELIMQTGMILSLIHI